MYQLFKSKALVFIVSPATLLMLFNISTSISAYAQGSEESFKLEQVVVTATREEKPRHELSESIDVIDAQAIESVAPTHPSDILNRSAGVHINNLGGEGHMTAIRQPITTGGVYLFLEDGIPIRPTGFFNHNALYEVDIPHAERLEIIKGPGSALYGSDAIGGVINSITKPSPDEPELTLAPEVGEYGWQRILVSGGAPVTDNTGFRLDLNLTDSDGYRDESNYSRYASTLRMDGFINDLTAFKTVASYTMVDQSGTSGLERSDYRNDPQKNLYHNDIGKREVDAFRLSTEIAYEPDNTHLFTLSPFLRYNHMDLMPSWMITYDPNIRDYEFQSYGLLTKYRRNLSQMDAVLITGLDLDYTPSTYEEDQINVTQTGDTWTDFNKTGIKHYDFEADQTSVSPYVHAEWQIAPKIRVNGGLRYDYFRVSYDNQLAAVDTGRHIRPPSQTVTFDHASPKLGAVYQWHPHHNTYASYKHAFRVPSVGQLFRSGSSVNTTDLDPVKSDSFEIGLRGQTFGWLHYNTAIFHMIVKDDIVSFIDGSDRKVTNAGETRHQGIEIGLNAEITDALAFNAAWTYTKQEYEDYQYIFQCFPPACIPPVRETRNFSGFDVGKAPETLGNLAISYHPGLIQKLQLEFEWVHMGDYFTDETNTAKYDGHNLFNLRAQYDISKQLQCNARLLNVTDRLYSTYTSNQVGDPDIQYRPGLPRTLFLGLRAQF